MLRAQVQRGGGRRASGAVDAKPVRLLVAPQRELQVVAEAVAGRQTQTLAKQGDALADGTLSQGRSSFETQLRQMRPARAIADQSVAKLRIDGTDGREEVDGRTRSISDTQLFQQLVPLVDLRSQPRVDIKKVDPLLNAGRNRHRLDRKGLPRTRGARGPE